MMGVFIQTSQSGSLTNLYLFGEMRGLDSHDQELEYLIGFVTTTGDSSRLTVLKSSSNSVTIDDQDDALAIGTLECTLVVPGNCGGKLSDSASSAFSHTITVLDQESYDVQKTGLAPESYYDLTYQTKLAAAPDAMITD